jgi:hypothetical protein
MAWTASIKLDVANLVFSRTPVRFEPVFVGDKVVYFRSSGPELFCMEDRSLTKLVSAIIYALWTYWAESEGSGT